MNASPQRREIFYGLQIESGTKIVPIQDVKTRWNSTYLMLRRAKRLRRFFIPFCTELDRLDLALDDEEWRQIDYLLWITEPFFVFTNELSRPKTALHIMSLRSVISSLRILRNQLLSFNANGKYGRHRCSSRFVLHD